MNETVQICSRCLLPNTYPGIEFNEQGICNHCLEYKKPQLLGEAAFSEKINSKHGNKYDCVVGISGGKDSCYVAYLAKEKFNLRTLAVCYDFPFLVDLARQNVRTLESWKQD
jgi:predicted PP-loop superfamily ATPase